MLIVKEEITFGVGFGLNQAYKQISVRCEHCFNLVSVWSYQVKTCPACQELIPNAITIKGSLKERVIYHFEPLQRN